MKKIILLTFIALVTATFTTPTSDAMSSKPKNEVPFEETAGWNKIDLRLREAWKTSKDNKTLECIIKTTVKTTSVQKDELSKAGFKSRTFIGKIATGSVKREDLSDVANLDFMESMELSTPMTLKVK